MQKLLPPLWLFPPREELHLAQARPSCRRGAACTPFRYATKETSRQRPTAVSARRFLLAGRGRRGMGLRWCRCADLWRPSRLMNRRRCRMHLRRRGRTRPPVRAAAVPPVPPRVRSSAPPGLPVAVPTAAPPAPAAAVLPVPLRVRSSAPPGQPVLWNRRPRLRCPQRLSYRCRRVFVHWRRPNGLLRCQRPRRRLRLAQRRLDSSSTHGSGQPASTAGPRATGACCWGTAPAVAAGRKAS